ncbi:MAG: hypothetical protein FI719_00920 [SAR202 cluster bacterium]|nr:hypothetical protein [SAR202 cluster bacterium]
MTKISIEGDKFLVNGTPTHEGATFRGVAIEGLMMNSRMANAVFDDDNEFTRHLWAYPDNEKWDADRNTNELIEMLPTYKSKGLSCIDVNLQGASPLGYYKSSPEGLSDLMTRIQTKFPDATEPEIWAGLPSTRSQPWDSGAFTENGDLKPAFMKRVAKVIEAADEIGMIVCLGLFYFGQDERISDEESVKTAVEKASNWVLAKGYTNVLLEINNECDVPLYEHEILCPDRIHELINLAKSISKDGARLLVSTSFTRRMVPTEKVIESSDFILLHGNGMHDPVEITNRVQETRNANSYKGQPIFFNEDDHFEFENETNNFVAALEQRAGWGFFDPGPGAGGTAAYGNYVDGYQNPPINWTINTSRKESFFWILSKLTGR